MQKKPGILVGCDQSQEWLLPWWWRHFYLFNSHIEVAFADFGMSEMALMWCEERGSIISIPSITIAEKEAIDPQLAEIWEEGWKKNGSKGDLWSVRKIWFKKAYAMSQSPFERTVWIDLDCEIKGSLSPLLHFPLISSCALLPTGSYLQTQTSDYFPHYNTGVLIYEGIPPLIEAWISAIEEGSHYVRGEEELLSYLIHHLEVSISHIPEVFNWNVTLKGNNPLSLINHYMGEEGKIKIKALLNALT